MFKVKFEFKLILKIDKRKWEVKIKKSKSNLVGLPTYFWPNASSPPRSPLGAWHRRADPACRSWARAQLTPPSTSTRGPRCQGLPLPSPLDSGMLCYTQMAESVGSWTTSQLLHARVINGSPVSYSTPPLSFLLNLACASNHLIR